MPVVRDAESSSKQQMSDAIHKHYELIAEAKSCARYDMKERLLKESTEVLEKALLDKEKADNGINEFVASSLLRF